MKKHIFSLLAALVVAVPAGAQAVVPPEKHGLPGQAPGTEQWIVEFEKRSFDLSELRSAIRARRPAAEVDAIVQKLEARMQADQAPFVEAVEKIGGRVYEQLWIVNTCAIEIPHAKLGAVAALPNVKRLWANEAVQPLIKAATSASNHNSDAVNAAGQKGKGVTTAIVDTGLDSNCASKNRPHRTFYEDGNLNGRNRLRANKQVGRIAADNTHPHGTGVAGIAAGGIWGNSQADHGHAPHADIVGYSLSNSSSGGSDFVTVQKAWQTVLADVATFNIKTANNSYSGSNDPLNPSQQALDAAALNGDVSIVVAAGNSSSSTTSSQAVVNGIAVGATNRNVHTMATFSSRGPHSGTQRFFPDITGNGVSTIMPDNDAEASNYTASGTSMASPQVCGAATLMRAENTLLTADETKAILLASALDISTQNPQYNRNAYGWGLVKDDAAIALVKDTANHGNAKVTTASKTWQKVVVVRRGRTYRAAIAWMRQDVALKTWSNLDVEILQGSTVVASSKTPNNLDEVAIFRATADGALLFRVTGVTIQKGDQSFGWAFTEGSGPPVESEYEAFGSGCAGASQGCAPCVQENWTKQLANKSTAATRIAIMEVNGHDLNLCGVDLYMAARTAATNVTVSIYDMDNRTALPNAQQRSATVQVGTTPGVYSFKFPTYRVTSRDIWFIVIDSADKLNLPASPSGRVGVHYPWTGSGWGTLLSDTRWQYQLQCDRGMQIPVLSNTGTPVLAKTFNVDLAKARGNAPALFFLGISNSTWGPIPLPLTYAPGCQLLVSGELINGLATNATGNASVPVAIPNDKDLINLIFFNQFLVNDTVNAIGWISSNAGKAKIGEF